VFHRVKTSLQTFLACHPKGYSISTIEELNSDLKGHIYDYHQLCDTIIVFVGEHPELEADDEAITGRHEEEFQCIRNQLTSLLEARKLWADCQTLCIEMEEELDDPNPDSTSFRVAATQLTGRAAPLVAAARTHVKAMFALKDTVAGIQDMSRKLKATLRGSDTIPAASVAIPLTPAPEPSHSHASLKIELPSFDGSLEHWEQFETLFLSTVRTRAKGFTPMELRGLLRNSVKPDRARRILDNLPSASTSLEEMLAELKTIYGSPAVVGPILVQKILAPSKLVFDFHSLAAFHDNFCLPWKRFCSFADDSLSTFLAILAVHRMTDACRDEWLRTADSTDVPKMEDITTFVKKWMTKFPSHSNHHLPSPAPSKPSKPPYSKPDQPSSPNKKPFPSCHACGQNHSLHKCETFRNLGVDARTDLVKKHKLCMNCFSSTHGYRSCPGRFSCKTCNARHHTMLHRETAPSSTPAVPSAAPTTATVPSLTGAATAPTSRSLLTTLVNI